MIMRVGVGVPLLFFFSSRRRHTRSLCDWSSDVCSSDLMLEAAGIEAGVYTSPHLVRFSERIRVGKVEIAEANLAGHTAEVRRAVEAMRREGLPSPTYFETTTALAFVHFRRRRVPLGVLEVGMGGRYDATNVANPLACAITPIDLDHTQFLGATVAEIAFQKAGIVRRGVPVVVA